MPRDVTVRALTGESSRTATKQAAIRYSLAVLASVAALILRKILNPLLGAQEPFHTAWLAVVFSAWYCGIGPSVVTVLITLFGIWYWFLPPYNSFTLQSYTQAYGLLFFLAFSGVIVFLGEHTRRIMLRRERAEKELREVQEKLEDRVRDRTAALQKSAAALEQKTAELVEKAAMLDLANDAIFVRTASDTISFWNEGAERLYGWTKQEAIGRSPHELLHTEFPVSPQDIKARQSWKGELRHTKRDGIQIIVASRWTTLRDHGGNATGWLEINTDITQRKRAEDAARALSGRILTLQDEERRRIARGLHDSLGQYLAALKMNLDTFPSPDQKQAAVTAECLAILEKCIAETRTISHLLHPPLLDESGLGSAARWYVDEFARRSGIAINFHASADLLRLNSEIEIAMFRAIQEGLTNVHRHSGASSVDIHLSLEGNRVRLEIRDNGRGMPEEQLNRLMEGTTEAGVGLAGMRERIRELAGNLEIQSDRTGTRLIVVAPLSSKPAVEPDILVA